MGIAVPVREAMSGQAGSSMLSGGSASGSCKARSSRRGESFDNQLPPQDKPASYNGDMERVAQAQEERGQRKTERRSEPSRIRSMLPRIRICVMHRLRAGAEWDGPDDHLVIDRREGRADEGPHPKDPLHRESKDTMRRKNPEKKRRREI